MTMHSGNGWLASPNPDDIGLVPLVVGGIAFPPGVRGGAVHTVLSYVATEVHKRVEPFQGGWGYSFRANVNDPDSLSNHSSATAIDYNPTDHPNAVATTQTWTDVQIAEVHVILAEAQGVVRWGGDYHSTPDSMHFEINAGPTEVAAAAKHLGGQYLDGGNPTGGATFDTATVMGFGSVSAPTPSDGRGDVSGLPYGRSMREVAWWKVKVPGDNIRQLRIDTFDSTTDDPAFTFGTQVIVYRLQDPSKPPALGNFYELTDQLSTSLPHGVSPLTDIDQRVAGGTELWIAVGKSPGYPGEGKYVLRVGDLDVDAPRYTFGDWQTPTEVDAVPKKLLPGEYYTERSSVAFKKRVVPNSSGTLDPTTAYVTLNSGLVDIKGDTFTANGTTRFQVGAAEEWQWGPWPGSDTSIQGMPVGNPFKLLQDVATGSGRTHGFGDVTYYDANGSLSLGPLSDHYPEGWWRWFPYGDGSYYYVSFFEGLVDAGFDWYAYRIDWSAQSGFYPSTIHSRMVSRLDMRRLTDAPQLVLPSDPPFEDAAGWPSGSWTPLLTETVPVMAADYEIQPGSKGAISSGQMVVFTQHRAGTPLPDDRMVLGLAQFSDAELVPGTDSAGNTVPALQYAQVLGRTRMIAAPQTPQESNTWHYQVIDIPKDYAWDQAATQFLVKAATPGYVNVIGNRPTEPGWTVDPPPTSPQSQRFNQVRTYPDNGETQWGAIDDMMVGFQYRYTPPKYRWKIDLGRKTVLAPGLFPDFTYTAQDNGWVIDFDASDTAGEVVTYSWDFADPLVNPQPTEGKKISHMYRVDQDYEVTLTVTGVDGTTASVTHTVTVPGGSIIGDYAGGDRQFAATN